MNKQKCHAPGFSENVRMGDGAALAATPLWAAECWTSRCRWTICRPCRRARRRNGRRPADLAETDPAVLGLNRIAFGPRAGRRGTGAGDGGGRYIEQQARRRNTIDDAQ